MPTRFIRFPREPHGFREPHHMRIRDTEEISWLMKYARGIDWKAPDRKDADAAAPKKTNGSAVEHDFRPDRSHRYSLPPSVAARSLARALTVVLRDAPAGAINLQDTMPFDAAVAHGDAAERAEVLHPPEQPAGQARVAAARGQGRLARRGRRSAGARALPRAHGVQRQRALQAGRADLVLRIDRRAARPARQRLHQLRRDGLHARAADRQAGDRRRRG